MCVVVYLWLCYAGIQVIAFNEASFRSTWNEAGKPILRMGLDEQNEEDRLEPSKGVGDWVDSLRSKIAALVTGNGYDVAKPHIKRLVNDAEKSENVMLHVEGTSKINYKTLLRAANPSIDWPPTPPPDPKWLQDLKSFVKNLIQNYGRVQLDDQIRPVISYLEKHQKIKVNDIDVDQLGEVFVKWEKIRSPYA